MADVSVTAANVALVSGTTATANAGGTITAGQPIYRASDGDVEAAQADASGTDDVIGIALNGASSGQPVVYAKPGSVVNIGGTLVLGTNYMLSADNAGGIAPAADLANPDYVTFLGMPLTTANLEFQPIHTNTQVPA